MNYFENLVKKDIFKKLFALLVLVAVFYIFKGMINLFLFTFIFSYAFYSVQVYISKKINKVFKISRKVVTIGVYLLLVLSVVLVLINYIPLITKQLLDIGNQISNFDIDSLKNKIDPRLLEIVKDINIKDYLNSAGTGIVATITDIGKISFNVFIALILSLFFVLEKDELKAFGAKLEHSNVAYFYSFYRYFSKHFLESFGKVLHMQFIVAFVNGVLSTIMLGIIGFPQIFGLGFMIFIFGLIPVAGVIISLIPLTVIAFNVGGVTKIIYVFIMIAILHALESYILNPKLMSAKTKLPVFITFAVLLVSENLMGIWGLLIGLPMFMFLLKVAGIEGSNK